jgi:hypothetical protein
MIAFTAPVRFRLVASGLMIEKVRSTAIGQSSFLGMCRSRRLIAAARAAARLNVSSALDTLYHEPKGLRARLPLR